MNIYHLSHRQRKLSLRFLAWAVLHSAIQTDTHDSIEDARTALQLYEHYNRLEVEGTWEDILEDVYREGKQTVRISSFNPDVSEPALTYEVRTQNRTSKSPELRLSHQCELTLVLLLNHPLVVEISLPIHRTCARKEITHPDCTNG